MTSVHLTVIQTFSQAYFPKVFYGAKFFYLSSETKILTLSYNSKLYKVPKGKFQGYKNKLNKSHN